jgi:hypothetical protein
MHLSAYIESTVIDMPVSPTLIDSTSDFDEVVSSIDWNSLQPSETIINRLIKNSLTPFPIIKRLIDTGNLFIQMMIAFEDVGNQGVLDYLALKSEDEETLTMIAASPNVSTDTLQMLISNKSPWVRSIAHDNLQDRNELQYLPYKVFCRYLDDHWEMWRPCAPAAAHAYAAYLRVLNPLDEFLVATECPA